MKKTNLITGRKGQFYRISKYDISFRRSIAKQYVEGNKSMPEIALENGLSKSLVKSWVKQFSSELALPKEIIVSAMTEEEAKDMELLKKQNEALKQNLDYERMKNFALETMIDLAKEEIGVDLRKNSGAKQPKE